jgi:hypothetical protein
MAAPNADIGDGSSRRRTLALRLTRRRRQADLAKPDLLDARRTTGVANAEGVAVAGLG